MKKLKILCAGMLAAINLSISGQPFQKVFGRSKPDQMELRNVIFTENKDMFGCGTFRNITYLQNANFLGSLARLDSTGQLKWYKTYLPNDAVAMDGLMFTSVFQKDSLLYCYGFNLANAPRSGYYLTKLTKQGAVLWSKFVGSAQVDMLTKAVPGNNAIYAVMGNRLVKFDMAGNVQNVVKINTVSTNNHFNFRNVYFTSYGQVVATGEMMWNTGSAPVITFDANLNLLSGRVYSDTSSTEGGIYGEVITEGPDKTIIIGGNDGKSLCLDSLGGVKWASKIPMITGPANNNYNFSPSSFVGVQATNAPATEFITTLGGFYTSHDTSVFVPTFTFKYYAIVCSFNSMGNFYNFRYIRNGIFAGNHHEPYAIKVTDDKKTFCLAGTARDTALGYPNGRHVNFLKVGKVNALSCGEEGVQINVTDIKPRITSELLPVTLIENDTLSAHNKILNVFNVPCTIDSTYCLPVTGSLTGSPPPSTVTTSLNKSQVNDVNLAIYPNPASTQITIINGDTNYEAELRLLSIDGKLLINKKISAGDNSVNISNLPDGIYIVEIKTKEVSTSKKVVISR